MALLIDIYIWFVLSGGGSRRGLVQCLSQDFDFFPKKELFNLFRELLAKERSYPFTVKIAR